METQISIHALLAESDHAADMSVRRETRISIHALLAESDPGKVKVVEPGLAFLSTLSLRRATRQRRQLPSQNRISIHALLAESDRHSCVLRPSRVGFLSTLSLRRATYCCCSCTAHNRRFLSTLSLRRATINGLRHKCAIFYFYPRSPCGERLN